jgi:ATP-dependent Clp protease ATP-binding subunit ClpX
VKQYQKLLSLEGIKLEFEDKALDAVVKKAIKRKTGARALRAIMEETMLEIMYKVPSLAGLEKVSITPEVVTKKEEPEYIFRKEQKSA